MFVIVPFGNGKEFDMGLLLPDTMSTFAELDVMACVGSVKVG